MQGWLGGVGGLRSAEGFAGDGDVRRAILGALGRHGDLDLRGLERRTGMAAELLVGPALDLGVEGLIWAEWRLVRRPVLGLRERLAFGLAEGGAGRAASAASAASGAGSGGA